MVKLGDLEVFNQLYKTAQSLGFDISFGRFVANFKFVDFILAPLYILAHTYYLYNKYWMMFAAVIYTIGLIYFELIFVAIVFISFFLSDLLINHRVLRSSDANTRKYATLALTIVLCVFNITLITGGIEPYQGALVMIVFYLLQARYRTSTLTIAKMAEVSEKKTS